MNFKDICEANKSIKTTDIKGKEYAEVNQRIKAFRMAVPSGAIETEIVSHEGGTIVFKATVKDEEGNILGVGHAYEHENSSFINKTSYIENCETSAVGRALGMCGFGIDVSIASYEEVANAINNQDTMKAQEAMKTMPKTEDDAKKKCSKAQIDLLEKIIAEKHYNPEEILQKMNVSSFKDLTSAQASVWINKLKG